MKILYEKKIDDIYYRNDLKKIVPLQCRAHLHYHVEIVYLRRGYAKAYIDSTMLELKSGDLLAVFPNRVHRFEDETGFNEYDLFIINPNLAPDLADKIAGENPQDPIIHNATDNARIVALIEILRDFKSFPTEYKQVLLKGYITSFFAEILQAIPTRASNPDENQSIRSLVQYCSRNFAKDLSLSVLEEELHLNKYYISHLFGDKLGIRFNDYVNSLRISEACRLLRMSDMSITDISGSCGFGTLRTFNRSFIKQMGTAPSEYRKSNRDVALDVSIPSGLDPEAIEIQLEDLLVKTPGVLQIE